MDVPTPLLILPTTNPRSNVPSLIRHLNTNLLWIQAPFTLTPELVYKLLGEFHKQARSLYVLHERVVLVDMVPSHPWIMDRLLQYTGNKYINGYEAYVYFKKAAAEVPPHFIMDYASVLYDGTTPRRSMNANFLYPNPSWEAPASMVPFITLPAGTFDKPSGAAAENYSDVFGHFADDPPELLD